MSTFVGPAAPAELEPLELPARPLPRPPDAARLWSRAIVLALFVLGLFLLDQLANLLMNFWLLQSLGYEDVFWTNFSTGAVLFGIALVSFGAAVAFPGYVHGLDRADRRRALGVALFVGLLAGYLFSGRFRDYLLLLNGKDFGRNDPVFGNDIGFYVFDLPAIWTSLDTLILAVQVLLVSSVVCSLAATRGRERAADPGRTVFFLGRISSPLTVGALAALLVLAAVAVWLGRYGLLTKDNTESSIPGGAEYLDVTGFFSTKNAITVESLALLFFAVGAVVTLRACRRALEEPASDWRRRLTLPALALALLPGLAVDVAFRSVVSLRNQTQVTPNEPVVQLPYIKRHIDATNAAYGLDKIETREWQPRSGKAPSPSYESLLRHPTIRNAPLWPGYNSWLERLVDPEYAQRVLQTAGDSTIYGPTLSTFHQQQKLRPYYDFMDVDTVRYDVGGQPRLYASSVRELPLIEPQPWLAWWGQRFLLFTHGYGLVMSPVSGETDTGQPVYHSYDIPIKTADPALATENPAVYYGEGAGSMAYSNVKGVKEHDYPTAEGRAQVAFPDDVGAGVRIDSPLKRVVFGWKSRQFLDIFFSDLIDSETRVHYFRTPFERIQSVAPFLYTDSDPYAVTRGDGITWMLNGMTTTTRYPYSVRGELGDKSDRRTPTPKPTRWVNYVRDAVKGTVDAYTGQIRLYKFADEPIIETWSEIYPDLFRPKKSMPPRLREQVQYPVQLMHIQFDDVYIYSHMKDPLTFFSQEDLLDDGDEVVGSLLDDGRAVTFSIEPYYWIAETGQDLPASSSRYQFAQSMIFTPENALNLRAIATAYMDGEDYGRLSLLEIPKGTFYPGPEQADTAIEQDAFISQQIGLWTRLGLEVIRGHTTPLIVDGELIYVEPLFTRSLQNPIPQLKRVIVVVRGRPQLSRALPESLRAAFVGRPEFPLRPGPELGGEPSFRLKEKRFRPLQEDRPTLEGAGGESRTDTSRAAGESSDAADYARAEQAMRDDDYDTAIKLMTGLGGYRDAKKRLAEFRVVAARETLANARRKLRPAPQAAVSLTRTSLRYHATPQARRFLREAERALKRFQRRQRATDDGA